MTQNKKRVKIFIAFKVQIISNILILSLENSIKIFDYVILVIQTILWNYIDFYFKDPKFGLSLNQYD